MYCSRIAITGPDALRLLGKSIYESHNAVWQFFADAPDRKRDFIFRQEAMPGGMLFYVVSQRPPQPRTGWKVSTKPYAPKLHAGDRLQFSLRANPVRSARDSSGKQQRHDVVMDAKRRAKAQGRHPGYALLEQEAGLAWLEERSRRLGFMLHKDSARAHSYTRHRLRTSKGHMVTCCSLDFDGLLTVQEPDLLRAALLEGVGPSKGFGCGLMLLRRA